jgi:hypothetical protein
LIKTEILLWLRMRVAYQSTALFDIVKMGNIYNTFASEYIWHIWSHHFECFMVTTMTWLTLMKYLFHKWPRICSTCRKHLPVLSSFMIIIGFVTRLTQRVPLMQQELLTLPEQLSSLPVFRWDSCYSIIRFMCMLWITIGI